MVQRILVHALAAGVVATLVACSTAPSATDNRASQQQGGVTSGKKTCEQKATSKGLSACVDCCLQANPKAQGVASALGQCNSACGKKGSTACFSKCEQTYVDACKAQPDLCRNYNKCSATCFGT